MVANCDTRVAAVPYSNVVDATLARVLDQAIAGLIEPRVTDPQRALEVLDCLVETIVGFAIGTIAGDVFRGVRTWFGDETLGALRERLGAGWPRACRHGVALDRAYLDDADKRPLVDELAKKLHVRLCRMTRDVLDLIDAVYSSIEPTRRHLLTVMFDLLAKQENLETRLLAELTFGWSMYIAAIAERAFPPRDNRTARSQALWLAWEHQLGGSPVLTRDETEAAGYITLVA